MNPTTAHREGFIGREEYQKMHAQNAGDRIEDLCQSVQDAVNEVISLARKNSPQRKVFEDLNIEIYAHPYALGGISWGVDSLVSNMNIKRGIVK